MLFNSYLFIFFFLPIVLIGFLLLRKKTFHWPLSWIVLSSLFYYGWWNPRFLILLMASIFFNLIFGKILVNSKVSKKTSRFVLTLGVLFNLVTLGYFKYAGFFVTNLNELFKVGLPVPEILLPLGISFITFQKIAFLVDAHRGLVRNFTTLNYIFFVTFFPQLIAGPIVHHAEIMQQLGSNSVFRNFKANFSIGISIFIIGLFKKVVVADSLAVYADTGYLMINQGHPLDTSSAWITVLAYSFQLYYDFSGYSDMAIGLARMFGVHLPVNFYSPYKAASIIDFWRRWHITLSRFLRDYLYIPLGGNRKGGIRRYINLALVMILGGLWHGANWTFAIWGGLHGFLLICNHLWRKLPFTRYPFYRSFFIRIISVGITFFLVTLAWIPFRAATLHDAGTMFLDLFPNPVGSLSLASLTDFLRTQTQNLICFQNWFIPQELWPSVLPPDYLSTIAQPAGLLLIINLLVVFFFPNTYQLFNNFKPALDLEKQPNKYYCALSQLDFKVACAVSLMLVFSILQLSHISPFLYFQF